MHENPTASPKNSVKKSVIRAVSFSSPVALTGITILISLQLQLSLILNVLLPFCVLLLYCILLTLNDLKNVRQEIQLIKNNSFEKSLQNYDVERLYEKYDIKLRLLRDEIKEERSFYKKQAEHDLHFFKNDLRSYIMKLRSNDWDSLNTKIQENNKLLRNELQNYARAEKALIKSTRMSSIPEGCFEVYLKYKSLEALQLAQLIQAIDDLYRVIYGLLYIEDFESNKNESSLNMFNNQIDEIFKVNLENRLEIESIFTGDSIKIRLKSGILPSFDIEDENITIGMPKGIAAAALTGYLLSASLNYTSSSVKAALETIKTYKEIQKIELDSVDI